MVVKQQKSKKKIYCRYIPNPNLLCFKQEKGYYYSLLMEKIINICILIG